MRFRAFVVSAALAAGVASAFGGSRFVNTTGGLPSDPTDGVDLRDTVSCRGTGIMLDGGNIMGGKLIPYYYDPVVGWHQGRDDGACVFDSSVQVDAGNRYTQTCEWVVQAPYGRAAVVPSGTVNAAGTAVQLDSVHLECFGGNISVKADAGAQ